MCWSPHLLINLKNQGKHCFIHYISQQNVEQFSGFNYRTRYVQGKEFQFFKLKNLISQATHVTTSAMFEFQLYNLFQE